MEVIFYIFVFILGTIIGSFLNVVIYRLGTGASITHSRSMCFSCGKTLSWYELVPVFSFIIQNGKCRKCKSKISWQYLFVELVTGLLFLLTTWRLNLQVGEVLFYWVIMSIFVVISVYDIRHKIIPNGFVYSFIILSAILLIWRSSIQILTVWDILAGPILFVPFAALWFFSKGTWMGFGDAKLAWGIGWLLGLSGGVAAMILAFWTGALWGLGLIALSNIGKLLPNNKGFTIKSEIPFGPFLILGTILVLFFNIDIFSLSLVF